MNAQEIFDTVARHLLTQRFRSVGADGKCAYRVVCAGGVTRKCAAGVLIPDETYSRELEGWSVTHATVQEALGENAEHLGLISRLQTIHDNYEPIEWPAKLTGLATLQRLSPEVIEEFSDAA